MTAPAPLTPANQPADGTDRYPLYYGAVPNPQPPPAVDGADPAALTDEELAAWEQDDPYNSILQRRRMPILIAALRASRAEVEGMADALWAISDGDGCAQDRIIAAGGLGDRYDHSKPNGR